jgi:GT2 family glycosyltransferase
MSDVAVLVLNWNGIRWLQPCFEALERQEVDFEPWLIDNGSQDGSIAFVRERLRGVRMLQLDRNLGFGAAYNRAVAATGAPYVVLLNNDTVVQPGWLMALVQELDAHPEAAAVGSKLLYLDQPETINHAGGQLTPLGAAFDIDLGAPDNRSCDVPRQMSCVTGAAVALRREAFGVVGGFDEHYFAYFEDADLCWRFWLRGYTIRYQPRARVLHAYGGSTESRRFGWFRVRHCQLNRLQNMTKNLEVGTLTWAVPASLLYDAMRIGQALRRGRRAEIRALISGSAAYARLLPATLRARQSVQATRTRSDSDLFTMGVLASLRVSAREWRRLGRVAKGRA